MLMLLLRLFEQHALAQVAGDLQLMLQLHSEQHTL
jgi:hypothetical protein